MQSQSCWYPMIMGLPNVAKLDIPRAPTLIMRSGKVSLLNKQSAFALQVHDCFKCALLAYLWPGTLHPHMHAAAATPLLACLCARVWPLVNDGSNTCWSHSRAWASQGCGSKPARCRPNSTAHNSASVIAVLLASLLRTPSGHGKPEAAAGAARGGLEYAARDCRNARQVPGGGARAGTSIRAESGKDWHSTSLARCRCTCTQSHQGRPPQACRGLAKLPEGRTPNGGPCNTVLFRPA